MTGEEKTAIILLTLKPDVATEVLRNFSQVDIMRIGKAIARMKKISTDELRNIAKDFCEMAAEGGGFIPVNKDSMKRLFTGVMDAKTANDLAEKISSANSDENPVQEKLRFMDPRMIMDFTRQEHPQTIALILAHLKPEQAAEILEGYSQPMQADIARRMANLRNVTPEIIEEMATTLEREVFSISTGGRDLGGTRAVADILNSISRSVQQSIMSIFEESEPGLAAEVRDFMFNFEDVLKLDDKSLQEIIKETNSADMAKALKMVDEAQRERIFRNMSKRAAEIIKEEIQLLPPTRLSDIENCQKTITDTARRLEESGVIVIQRTGDVKDAFV
ncbi:MAG: flagellar motor switch protein FliG [Smithellaceae bacterium]|nr:flagellar motor switch protein FliG [Smithellaceae bacterium]